MRILIHEFILDVNIKMKSSKLPDTYAWLYMFINRELLLYNKKKCRMCFVDGTMWHSLLLLLALGNDMTIMIMLMCGCGHIILGLFLYL